MVSLVRTKLKNVKVEAKGALSGYIPVTVVKPAPGPTAESQAEAAEPHGEEPHYDSNFPLFLCQFKLSNMKLCYALPQSLWRRPGCSGLAALAAWRPGLRLR